VHLRRIGKVASVDFANKWSDCCMVRESVDSKWVASSGERAVEVGMRRSGYPEQGVVKSGLSILSDEVMRGVCTINECRGLLVLESAVSSSRLSSSFDTDGLPESRKGALE
jgi:hypothetical protein